MNENRLPGPQDGFRVLNRRMQAMGWNLFQIAAYWFLRMKFLFGRLSQPERILLVQWDHLIYYGSPVTPEDAAAALEYWDGIIAFADTIGRLSNEALVHAVKEANRAAEISAEEMLSRLTMLDAVSLGAQNQRMIEAMKALDSQLNR